MIRLLNFTYLNGLLTLEGNPLLMNHSKNKLLATGLFLLGLTSASNAQQWGDYTLYSTGNSTTAYLIDTNNVNYHTWTGLSGTTAYSNYLLPGGVLLRTVDVTNNVFTGGGMAGRVQKVDWTGTILWDYTYSTTQHCSHHDICALPNGNVMLIAYELKSASQVTAAGCTSNITMWPDHVIEVQPTGTTTGTIVWEWHLWDHLCQDVDSGDGNYVTSVNDHPELFDINWQPQKEIWHMNGIDYNPILDQIVLSAHNTDEFYVIDHSTTTAEAASHSGGRSGRGGDFLYRWGNADAYEENGTNFNVIHDAHWIPQGCPNAGYLVALNNKGISNTISCVDQVNPPYNGFNYSYTANTAWLPAAYTLRRQCTGGTTNMGNSQQLPNGNMLICLALSGTMYEIDPNGTTIWSKTASNSVAQAFRYSACQVSSTAPAIPTVSQNGNVLSSSAATTYQWFMDGVLIAGATQQAYTATQSGTYVVQVTDSNGCWYSYSLLYDFTLTTDISAFDINHNLTAYPNPTSGILNLSGEILVNGDFTVDLYDAAGRLVYRSVNEKTLDLSGLDNGVYVLNIATESAGIITRRIAIAK